MFRELPGSETLGRMEAEKKMVEEKNTGNFTEHNGNTGAEGA